MEKIKLKIEQEYVSGTNDYANPNVYAGELSGSNKLKLQIILTPEKSIFLGFYVRKVFKPDEYFEGYFDIEEYNKNDQDIYKALEEIGIQTNGFFPVEEKHFKKPRLFIEEIVSKNLDVIIVE